MIYIKSINIQNVRPYLIAMYIRRTSIKSHRTGELFYTYRLFESVRIGDKVRQQTLINLDCHFDVPRERLTPLSQRIETIIQADLFPSQLDPQPEKKAQYMPTQWLTQDHVDLRDLSLLLIGRYCKPGTVKAT